MYRPVSTVGMDVPAGADLESISDGRYARNNLADPPLMQTAFDNAAMATAAEPAPRLNKRKSLRLRPTELLESQDGIPPRPLRTPKSQPNLRSRASAKMSLFNLFSKPKVERVRASAEPDFDLVVSSNGCAPQTCLTGLNHDADPTPSRPRLAPSKSYTRSSSRMMSREPPPPVPAIPTDQKFRSFEAVPYFQVWPQAIRHGTFETSTLAAQELIFQKHRARAAGPSNANLQDASAEGTAVTDSGGDASTSLKHSQQIELPKKTFFLVTSGCLLQYAATGSNDRMPEKILQLGKDSAAYASDSIPGRHYVLEVSQAVDSNGEVVASTSSIFSRLLSRGAAARRAAAKLLIVMPSASEMDEWMNAIRKEIHLHGGKRMMTSSDSARGTPKVRDGAIQHDLPNALSQVHRFQVKRDPARVMSVIYSDSQTLNVPPGHDKAQTSDAQGVAAKESSLEVVRSSESGSVEDRPRSASDAHSTDSSTACSEQQSLNNLRDSTRASHTSTATTLTLSSRTNSMTLEQHKDAPDSSPYRNFSPQSLAKRRSAVPIAVGDGASPRLGSLTRFSPGGATAPAVRLPSSELVRPSFGRLATAPGTPNIHGRVDRQDSPTIFPGGTERPESFLGDLPNPTTWASKNAPAGWASYSQVPFAERNLQRLPRSKTDSVVPANSARASRSFSIPLKINTIVPPTPSTDDYSEPVGSTLRSATDDLTSPAGQLSGPNTPLEIASGSDSTSGRFSLWPSSTPPVSSVSNFPPTYRPRLMINTGANTADGTSSMGSRPNSLQVRADLASAGLHPHSAHPTSETQTFSPIVGPTKHLRPVRSIAAMENVTSESTESVQQQQHFNFTTRRLVHDHEAPQQHNSQRSATSSRSRRASPSPSRPSTSHSIFPSSSSSSRPPSRGSRRLTRDRPPLRASMSMNTMTPSSNRTSLLLAPNTPMPLPLDLAIPMPLPITSMGPPPGPPPKAPLPALPPFAARSSSQLSFRAKSPAMRMMAAERLEREEDKENERPLSSEEQDEEDLDGLSRDGARTPVPRAASALGLGIEGVATR